ncbi:hypothetical protein N7536_009470 [Penicillium majusculum]|nr:hypothetical protein N7536_009470 [Penicillium majusculum]
MVVVRHEQGHRDDHSPLDYFDGPIVQQSFLFEEHNHHEVKNHPRALSSGSTITGDCDVCIFPSKSTPRKI